MPKIQEMKTKTGEVLFITIPKALAKFKGWKKGDELEFIEENGSVVLREKQ
ncbi:MAG: AbrB/MazE/SpoVT family DNA-binding domain-containing protein [Candidatus Hodarchaeota archaeon]